MNELKNHSRLIVRQRRELAELFGFETRNKYEICDEQNNIIGFCAEQNKDFLSFISRQVFGHWRSFELHFFDENKQEVMKTIHPFRLFFQEFTVTDQSNKKIGRIVQRFGIFTKKFDVFDTRNKLVFRMRSGFFSFWTFPFENIIGKQRAVLRRKWSGAFKELFLDADNFLIEYNDEKLDENERKLILAASVFTDLQYFERKAKS
jgi:hypothetical protein